MKTSTVKPRADSRATRARMASAAYFLILGTGIATWGSRIPTVQARLHLSPGVLGAALLAIAVGGLLAMGGTGWLIHRYGSAAVTRVSALAAAVALPLPIIAPSLPLLVVALLVFGAVQGAMDVAVNAQAVTVENSHPRPIMSSLHGMFSIGGLLGAGAASILLAQGVTPAGHGIGMAFVQALVALLAGPFLLPDHGESVAEAPAFARPRGVLLVLGLIGLLSMVGEGAILDWSALYLRNELGASASVAAMGFGAFSLAMAVGRLTGDRYVHRFGRVTVMRISAATAAVGLGTALILGGPLLAIVGFGCVGLGLSNLVPIVFSVAARVPGIPAGYGLAAVATVGYFGFLAGPPTLGFVAQITSIGGALALVVLFAALISLFAHKIRISAPASAREAPPRGACRVRGR